MISVIFYDIYPSIYQVILLKWNAANMEHRKSSIYLQFGSNVYLVKYVQSTKTNNNQKMPDMKYDK